jgi:hypothetical protein
LPPDIHLGHLLAVALAFTAAVAGARLTAAVGVLAAIALIAAGAERDSLTTDNVLVEFGSLIAVSALLVLFSVLRDRRNRELLCWAAVRRIPESFGRSPCGSVVMTQRPIAMVTRRRTCSPIAISCPTQSFSTKPLASGPWRR